MQTDDDRRCPDGPPTYPTPNGSKFPTPTVQNSPADRGRTAAAIGPSTGLVTDLLGCDGFATPEGNPAKTGNFIGLRQQQGFGAVPVASRLPAERPALFAVLCRAGAGNFDLTKRLVPRQQRIEQRQH